MADNRDQFRVFVVEALRSLGDTASVLEVIKHVWAAHEPDPRAAGDLFYTGPYDVRWAARYLRDNGYLKSVDGDRQAPCSLTALGEAIDLNELALSSKRKVQG